MSTRLGDYLRELRKGKGLTLRQVELLANGQLSNSYLCQLENGDIKHPSPNILYLLASIYTVPYSDVLIQAGYPGVEPVRPPLHIFSVMNVTAAEADSMLTHLLRLRQENLPPFDRGCAAWHSRFSIKPCNPYAAGTPESDKWDAGFEFAMDLHDYELRNGI